jgi:ribose-phosphate pyrophosphokinase
MENQIWSPSAAEPVASHRLLRLFALNGTDELGCEISKLLGHSLSAHEERDFEDGEHKARPLDPVSGADVFVIHSLHGGPDQSANDKLCRLLFFIGALKDAGARRVTAVAPYLCYSRKDRRTKANDPVTTRYVAALFEAIDCDAVVTLEVHNEAAFENAFRGRASALTAAPLLIDAIKTAVGNEPLCVISPDLGGGKRADLLREALESVLGRSIGKAFAEKHRSAGVVSGDLFVGDVAGATCIIVDDLISTGGTLVRAARAARAHGARRVLACVAHGLFMPGAETALADPAIDRILVTDVVPPFRLPAGPVRDKLDIVPAAPLLGEAIRRLHEDQPLTDLLVF